MFRVCCLRGDETVETLPREVLYRRYFSFYLFFHTLYFIISIIEFFMFQNERFAVLYFAAVFMLCVDCINNGFILLRADKPKRCLVFISICGIVSFLVYTISRVEAYIDIHSDGIYLTIVTLLYMVFSPIKLRIIYHNFKFMSYSAEKKKELLLAAVDFEDLSNTNEHDSNAIDNLILGTGPIDYQRMKDQNSNGSDGSNNLNNSNNNNNINITSNYINTSAGNNSDVLNQSASTSDQLGISNVENLSFLDTKSSLHSSQNSQGSSFLDGTNLNLKSINENREMSQSRTSQISQASLVSQHSGHSTHSYQNSNEIMNLNDVHIDTESRLQASITASNANSVIIHSTQSSMSSYSVASSDRIGSYVPRMDDIENRHGNGSGGGGSGSGSSSASGSNSVSSNSRPRTLSQKHPGFVSIE